MRAVLLAVIWLLSLTNVLVAQDLTALARVIAQTTALEQKQDRLTLNLGLSQGVPHRVYTLADPHQLVIELSEVTWNGLDLEAFQTAGAGPVKVGSFAPGWSGLVLDLAGPFQLLQSAMIVGETDAMLTVELGLTDEVTFRAASRAPVRAAMKQRVLPARNSGNSEDFVVVIDPGHGGIDPGAERDGVREAALMLVMARELRDDLRRAGGFEVHLTRDEDKFVSLPERASLARRLGATAFISLHADALDEGYAEGATVYTLSDVATDTASALLAERHNRADILYGVDLGGQDDEIATILLDLARLETTPRSLLFASATIEGLEEAGARLNSNPRRAADFAVLRSADVPSILVEVGFLSSEKDRVVLQSPEKRAVIIDGIVRGIENWAAADRQARAPNRQ